MDYPTLSEEDIAKYIPIIDSIFKNSDLATVSVKKVRTGLSAQTGADFSNMKKQIDEIITSRFDLALDEQGAVEESPEPEESTTTGSTSPAMTGTASPGNPKKRKSSAVVDEDARLAAELHAQLNGGRATRAGKPRVAKPVKKGAGKGKRVKKSKDTVESDGSGGERPVKPKRKANPNSAFMRPLILSQELARFCGESKMARTEVVKTIWAYVREHNLQDPKDRRYIICDDTLKPILGDKVHMFTMNKVLSTMMWKPDEVSQGSSQDLIPKLEPQEA